MAEEKSPARISLRHIAKIRSEMRKVMKKSKISKKVSYKNYYYMNSSEISSRNIYDVINENNERDNYVVEFWEAANVIEIELREKSSIDIEQLNMFRDDEDKKFLEAHEIKVIYDIKTDTEHQEDMMKIFKSVVSKIGGFVCSDSDDFMPILIK